MTNRMVEPYRNPLRANEDGSESEEFPEQFIRWLELLRQEVNRKEYMFPIWAEENSSLGVATYEWAFGNGADTPTGRGVVLHVPAGWVAEAVSMSLSINAGTATVELEISGTLQGSTADVAVASGTSAVNTFAAVPLVDGDVINFRTTTASGTSGPCQVGVWIRMRAV